MASIDLDLARPTTFESAHESARESDYIERARALGAAAQGRR